MILTRDMEVGVVYVADTDHTRAFFVHDIVPLDEKGWVTIHYRWVRSQYDYQNQVLEIDEELEGTFGYHPEHYVIEELP